MRRILTIAVVLLVVGTYAFAQTDKEILFRDMPWGTSYSDVDRLFPEFSDVYLSKGEEEGSPYDIKPGLTGLWQVSGRSNITDFEEVVKLDLTYINHWSI